MSEKKSTRGRLIKTEWNMNWHRESFQGVRCRVVTSRGSGSGMRVWILEDEEARQWKRKKCFWNNYCRNQGGMCYHHNLAGPEGGP
jgi:hypothetical protein